MATSTQKTSKKTRAKPSGTLSKKSQPKKAQATEKLRRERDEALEQLAAASDILRMIARSPTDLQSVLDAIAESAAKLCDAADAVVWRFDGDVFAPPHTLARSQLELVIGIPVFPGRWVWVEGKKSLAARR